MADGMLARNIGVGNISGGANITCGDRPDFLAHNFPVGTRKTPVTGKERAIGARIREARELLGVSMSELGFAMGGARQKVQFWEKGENFPPLSDFPRLCELLRTDANALLGIPSMKSLTEQEKTSARLKIQALAQATKDAKRGRKVGRQERLQRRHAAA